MPTPSVGRSAEAQTALKQSAAMGLTIHQISNVTILTRAAHGHAELQHFVGKPYMV